MLRETLVVGEGSDNLALGSGRRFRHFHHLGKVEVGERAATIHSRFRYSCPTEPMPFGKTTIIAVSAPGLCGLGAFLWSR